MEIMPPEFVHKIHDAVIERTGGAHGCINPVYVETAVQRPLTAFGGVELFPTVFAKAAAIAHSIATTHPFADGNKRTALFCAAAVLAQAGMVLIADDEVLEQTMVGLATSQMSLAEFAAFLEQHAV
ncbi:type II toxin-antitoxin system death-on-curing family toxin [bacterium]|nr:type II toxin-antitoxin system death-on-curing family toxin [bacterium]